MDHIDLPPPVPRSEEIRYAAIDYPIESRRYLPVPERAPEREFQSVLHARRSRRCVKPLTVEALSAVLWHSYKIEESRVEASGYVWTHRTTPSAGGRHPIELLVIDLADDDPRVELYDALAHSLCELKRSVVAPLRGFASSVRGVIGVEQGTCICFVADVNRTATKYLGAESLIWRDAGCLLASMHLVAEWHGLNFIAVGLTGDPNVTEALGGLGLLRGAGACVIGESQCL